MYKELISEIGKLKMIRQEVQEELKRLPKGKLRVSTSHGSFQYYLDDRYLKKKDERMIENLALREYYEGLLVAIKDALDGLEKLDKAYWKANIDMVYDKMPKGKQILIKNPVYTTLQKRIEEFENEQYENFTKEYPIDSEIYTVKGEHVRSKSEKIIADELYRRGIPYRYERPLVLTDRGRRVILHPDITAMNIRNGKIVMIEHLGLMDKQEYAQGVTRKLTLYEKNGYLIGRDIILLHESNDEPLNVHVLDEYIETFLM